MNTRLITIMLLSAVMLLAPSCRDIIQLPDADSSTQNGGGGQVPGDSSGSGSSAEGGDSELPPPEQSGDLVIGAGDESIFTDVPDWTGVKASDTALADIYGEDADIYWEVGDWGNVVTVIFEGDTAKVTKNTPDIFTYVSGAHVMVDMQTNSVSHAQIVLKGKSPDGSIKVYGDKKFKMTLCGLDLSSGRGPAINIQDHKRCFLHLADGATNRLSDTAVYSDNAFYLDPATAADEDRKGTFFTEGNLIVSGSGCMVLEGNYKHGLCTDGYLYLRPGPTLAVERSAGDCFHTKGDKDDLFGMWMDGGCLYGRAQAADTRCLKSDMNISLLGGIVDFLASGAGAKCIKAGDDENPGQNITIGSLSADGASSGPSAGASSGPSIKAVTTGGIYTASASYSAASSATTKGGIHPPGGGGFPNGSESGTKAKAIKASGTFTMNGGDLYISTTGSGAEGIESKAATLNSMVFNGGTTTVSAYDDAINSAGQIIFNGGYVFVQTESNDAVDSNYGKSGAIAFNGGVVMAHSARSPEEAFDCDNHSYMVFSGGTVLGTGGLQGGGSSSNPSCSVPVVYLKGKTINQGWFTVIDASGAVAASFYVPRTISSAYSFLTCKSFKSGTTYKYGTLSSAPSGNSYLWEGKYCEGGTATLTSSTSFTATSGLLSL